jgi:hypothetical protein
VIWWLRAEQPLTLRADLARLAVELRLVTAEADEHDATAAAREWLELNGRWLWCTTTPSARTRSSTCCPRAPPVGMC